MDLAIGAKQTWVMMGLFTRAGESKLVEALTYPVTGLGCVTRIYTESAVFELGGDAVVVRSTHGVSLEELQQRQPVSLGKAGTTCPSPP
jgi:3-oxoadipate CoA-transferase beta subunit